jgi:hypothetical protein
MLMQPPVTDGTVEEDTDDSPEDPANPYTNRSEETNFDYANPQEMFLRRQEQQMGAPQGPPTVFPGSVVIPAQDGQVPQPTSTAAPAFPGAGVSTSRPGEIAQPSQPTFTNPYGIPYPQAPQTPGTAPGQSPDRSKYFNPYQPQPPKPPGADR